MKVFIKDTEKPPKNAKAITLNRCQGDENSLADGHVPTTKLLRKTQ